MQMEPNDLFSSGINPIERDLAAEEAQVVDNIYNINDQYKEELKKSNPDRIRLMHLFNRQLMEGLKLQMYQ